MRKPTPEDRAEIARLREESRAARENMQAIIDRVERRRRERAEESARRGFLRRLIPFGR